MAWHQWRREVFGDPYVVWHEGPDFGDLLRLAEKSPEEVARMLPLGIAERDQVAASSIAVLAEKGMAPEGAEDLLTSVLPTATGTFLVRVAQALRALTGDESWARPVAGVLRSDVFWGERIDAALALAWFTPTVELIEALGEAVLDEDFLVRSHAANTLRRYAGRGTDFSRLKLSDKLADRAAGETEEAARARWREVADKLTADALAKLARS